MIKFDRIVSSSDASSCDSSFSIVNAEMEFSTLENNIIILLLMVNHFDLCASHRARYSYCSGVKAAQ